MIPNEKTPDVTDKLSVMMREHAGDVRIISPWYFKDKVKSNGDWDLKNTQDFNSDVYKEGFVFYGEQIRRDSPGNIHYGYVGSSPFWSSGKLLLKEAGKAQVQSGNSQQGWQTCCYGDDPRDQKDIQYGIDLRDGKYKKDFFESIIHKIQSF